MNNVRIANDIIFGYKLSSSITNENTVIISIIKPSNKTGFIDYKGVNIDVMYYEKIIQIIKKFIDNGLEVILMSFCKFEGDEEAISQIEDMIEVEYRKK